jgi:hypothetical protein
MKMKMKMYETDEEYRSFFLRMFELQEYDQEKIAKEMDRLYEYLILYEPFKVVLHKLVGFLEVEEEVEEEEQKKDDIKDLFVYLFSYEYLFSLYECIEDLKEHHEIRQEYLDNMMNIMK